MKTSFVRFVVFAGALMTGSVSHAAPTLSAAGHWEGTIKMEKRELEVVVDLAQNPKGAWIGAMSFPGSSTVDAPIGDIAVEGKAVHFSARVPLAATFDGNLTEDAGSIVGAASNADGETTFQLARHGEANVKLPPPSSPLPKEFSGMWTGTTEADGKTKHVGLKLAPAADGIAVATLIAIDHGNLEIPVTTITIQGRQLRFESRAISGNYQGALGDNGEISGEWNEATKHFPLTFKPTAADAKAP